MAGLGFTVAARASACGIGPVRITPFCVWQLGSESDAIAQISRGRIDMGSFTANSVALQLPGPASR